MMTRLVFTSRFALSSVLIGISLAAAVAESRADPWQNLAPGIDLGSFATSNESKFADSQIVILRLDAELWALELIGSSMTGADLRTAKQWCKDYDLAAAVNAGMFAVDYSTHVGYMRSGEHVNNARLNNYQSVAAFDPRNNGLPQFRIFDLDDPSVSLESILSEYDSAVQNLRLIKRPRQNRWGQQDKAWSEAALGEDTSGRILFIFCRSPFTMHDLNNELLNLDINLVCAQHLEGGPEAQLYLRVGETELELFGSFETGFREDDDNDRAWPIPNILGIRARD
jgi:hypothetical protein